MLQRCGPGERDTTEEKGQASLELVQSPTEGRRSRKKPGKKKKKGKTQGATEGESEGKKRQKNEGKEQTEEGRIGEAKFD